MTEVTVASAAGSRVAVHWQRDGRSVRLERIELEPQAQRRHTTAHHSKIDQMLMRLSDPARRSGQAWAMQAAGLTAGDDIASRVRYALATQVPAGQVISYGALAGLAGSPGAARAVGSVMRNNNWPLLVPCHRVVAADGSLGGFQGGCLGSVERKRALLLDEGVLFRTANRVAPQVWWAVAA